ncbi:peptide ABC transporter substrate-binding protein [Clostridium sporogenes]|nr:peptide ABC transporter substrate-binding protein [Clostridium sporogenes]NFS26020.1 peptide ABC transporter substrate-binding protein [Clostridium sporogenes]
MNRKMNKKIGFLILALMMISVTSLAGCGKSKSTSSKVSKQELNMPLEAEPDSLDLARVSDSYSALVGSQIIEGLTTVEIENGKEVAKPALAESWTTSKDQLKWTFKLRDAKWSDGVAVKAQDFVYGITRVLDPKTASPISSNIKFIKNAQDVIEGKKDISNAGIKAIDEKTLEITLEYPVPYFLSAAAGTAMFPVRKDVLEKHGNSYGTEAKKLVFCGPFVLDEWVHNSKLSFSKNPNYWDKDNVNLEKVNMKIISEEKAIIGEFENGKLDFVNVSSAEQIKKLSENKEYTKKTVDLPRTQYIFFNQKTPIFSNAKVRQAFSVALNREEIAHDIFKDVEPAAYGWLPPSMDVDGENFRKLAGDPIKKMISETQDPKALLIKGMEEAGLGKDPSSIKIQLMCKNTSKDFAEYLQQHFKKTLGVNIIIDPVEWPVFQERNRALSYEMGYKSYGGDYSDPASMMDLWMTGKKTVPTAWSNKEYDKLIDEASKSTDKELRKKNFIKAEKILIKDNATIIPYAYSQSNTFSHKYVKNLMEPSFTAPVLKHIHIEK